MVWYVLSFIPMVHIWYQVLLPNCRYIFLDTVLYYYGSLPQVQYYGIVGCCIVLTSQRNHTVYSLCRIQSTVLYLYGTIGTYHITILYHRYCRCLFQRLYARLGTLSYYVPYYHTISYYNTVPCMNTYLGRVSSKQ